VFADDNVICVIAFNAGARCPRLAAAPFTRPAPLVSKGVHGGHHCCRRAVISLLSGVGRIAARPAGLPALDWPQAPAARAALPVAPRGTNGKRMAMRREPPSRSRGLGAGRPRPGGRRRLQVTFHPDRHQDRYRNRRRSDAEHHDHDIP
jgi:hypothetical protein